MRMFHAASVIETVVVIISVAVAIRPLLMRAAMAGRMRPCALPLHPRSRRAARPGPVPRTWTADPWRAGGGVARTK
jgi:hypothetical protein